MTDMEYNGSMKKLKLAEVLRWVLTGAIIVTLYLANKVDREEAFGVFIQKEVYQEHVRAQDKEYNELIRKIDANSQLLQDINKYLRNKR